MFYEDVEPSGSGMKEISYAQAEAILREAKEKHLVPRPFRNQNDHSRIDGVCFCCDDCCGYFLNSDEKCDRGAYIENTLMEICAHCGMCVEVCYFKARKMQGGNMVVRNDLCFGCGLCADICPEDCIEMVPRKLAIY
jgi:ferredoxin